MILWFTVVQLVVAVGAGLLCLVLGFAGKRPNDYTVGALALVELLLVVQAVMAIVAPFAGNPAKGDPLEYGVYLVSAILLPIGGVIWALLERSRWSTVILGAVALALAVMIWRMQVIWTTPIGA
ncbi:hypothetical protein [Microbacterium sp. 22242]|uniref:hypothetical protein n=1 Tax=Microbacterium sp. 22242 TaxID=3453896 RepID=UPI003F8794EC